MNGEAEQLFDFIADCVGEFLQNNHTTQSNKSLSLGFTFSFPVNQTGVAQGTLIEWTKGFSTKGVVGKDVVELLNESLKRKKIKVKVSNLFFLGGNSKHENVRWWHWQMIQLEQ